MEKKRGGDYMEPSKELKFGAPRDKAKNGRVRATKGTEIMENMKNNRNSNRITVEHTAVWGKRLCRHFIVNIVLIFNKLCPKIGVFNKHRL